MWRFDLKAFRPWTHWSGFIIIIIIIHVLWEYNMTRMPIDCCWRWRDKVISNVPLAGRLGGRRASESFRSGDSEAIHEATRRDDHDAESKSRLK